MTGSKITPQMDGRMQRLENNSPNGCADGELNGRLENNTPIRWTDVSYLISSKITRQTDGLMQS